MMSPLGLVVIFAATCMAFPPPPPPGFDVLPPDVQQKLHEIQMDKTLGFEERHEKIHDVMINLPQEVKDKLPPPPGFDVLPKETQDQLKAIHEDRSLTLREKDAKVRQIFESLPMEVKMRLPRPPPPPPAFHFLPADVKAKINAINADPTMGFVEKGEKIEQMMKQLREGANKKGDFGNQRFPRFQPQHPISL